ncbi:MAG: hypothetical protein BWY88_00623 [Synergistetes bacterium ADurb.Bin520]|nr:MAG: hypothetical protein BWY88_00623 [Synergistetes bacterium ADurb.Bin520]
MGVRDGVVDDPGEVPRVLGVVVIETGLDELGMLVVPGENDGLGEPVPSRHLVPVFHQVPEHLVHRVPVKEPAVDGRRVHPVGGSDSIILVPPVQALPLGLLLVGKLVVRDPLPGKLQIHLLPPGGHQIAVAYRLGQLVGVRGHPRFQLEKVVGVFVHVLPGRGGEPHQQGVEVAEDRPVLLVDRPVGFVDDHQIKMPRTESGLKSLRLVDEPHHGGVRAHEDPPLGVPFRDKIHRAALGKVLLEGPHRLMDQRHPVRQKEDPLHPPGPLQHVHQGHGRPGLSRARGHHQQRLPPGRSELREDAADGSLLVVPIHDGGPYLGHVQGVALGTPEGEAGQLVLLEKPRHLPGRIDPVVPQPRFVAVGAEDEGADAVGSFQAIGVELGLLLSLEGIDGGALGFHHRQRVVVVAPEHVVRAPRSVWHGHPVLAVSPLFQGPPGAGELHVDEGAAGFRFGVVVVVRTLFRRSAGLGELVAQGLDFRVQGVTLLLGFQQRLVSLRELLFPSFELLTGDELPGGGGLGHQIVAPGRGVSSGGGGVGARQPVTAVVELLHHPQGVGGARGLGVVHRLVSHLLDEPGLLKDRLGQ